MQQETLNYINLVCNVLMTIAAGYAICLALRTIKNWKLEIVGEIISLAEEIKHEITMRILNPRGTEESTFNMSQEEIEREHITLEEHAYRAQYYKYFKIRFVRLPTLTNDFRKLAVKSKVQLKVDIDKLVRKLNEIIFELSEGILEYLNEIREGKGTKCRPTAGNDPFNQKIVTSINDWISAVKNEYK